MCALCYVTQTAIFLRNTLSLKRFIGAVTGSIREAKRPEIYSTRVVNNRPASLLALTPIYYMCPITTRITGGI